MNILFLGDIVGRTGRDAVKKHLPTILAAHKVDFTIVNAENAAHGFGVTEKICEELLKQNINSITLGNHAFDKEDIKLYIQNNTSLIRPYNFVDDIGNGAFTYMHNNIRVTVVNIICNLFMYSKSKFTDPFVAIDKILEEYILGKNTDIIFIDLHGEATSEKQAFAHYVDGKVSAVIGTHTHVPTSDYRVLNNGTAYQTDVGMCGDYDSVIGMNKEASLNIFFKANKKVRLQPAENEPTLCGVLININEKTGLANSISPVRLGGCLSDYF